MRPPQQYRGPSYSPRWDWRGSPAAPRLAEPAQASFAEVAPSAPAPAALPSERDLAAPLGAARAQLHENYIIAQTRDGVVIVDQHAAHERIVYERLKLEREKGGIERQMLLTPLIVDLDPDAAALIDAHSEELAGLGLIVEGFGPGAMMVREAPPRSRKATSPRWYAISPPISRPRTAPRPWRGGSISGLRPSPAITRCARAGRSSPKR